MFIVNAPKTLGEFSYLASINHQSNSKQSPKLSSTNQTLVFLSLDLQLSYVVSLYLFFRLTAIVGVNLTPKIWIHLTYYSPTPSSFRTALQMILSKHSYILKSGEIFYPFLYSEIYSWKGRKKILLTRETENCKFIFKK